MAVVATRMTADERRAAVLEFAREEFAKSGFHGTSTERIADRAGVSQPYLFRLFGTKKQLFLACVRAGCRTVLETFAEASEGLSGEEALHAMGEAYMQLLQDRTRLQAQLQAYAAACDDPEVRDVVQQGFGELVSFVEATSGAPPARLSRFMAHGMLLNVIASMDLLGADERWARHLLDGCLEESKA
jgi:AcrR family transcriptional regulator